MRLHCIQLEAAAPIRGGIDVGTGVLVEGELFGSSLVKAYVLESNAAKSPRPAVGKDLVNYLNACSRSPVPGLEGQVERKMAESILSLLKLDSEQQWFVDYAGPNARALYPGLKPFLERAADFARRSRNELKEQKNEKLFGYYTSLVRYLDVAALEPDLP